MRSGQGHNANGLAELPIGELQHQLQAIPSKMIEAANAGDTDRLIRLREHKDALQAEVERRVSTDLEMLREQLGQAEARLEAAQGEKAKIQGEAQALTEQILALQRKRTALNDSLQLAQSEVSSAEYDVRTLRQRLERLESRSPFDAL